MSTNQGSSSQPMLPISNPNSSSTTTATSTAVPAPTRLFISRLLSSLRSSLSHRRPWTELIDRSAFSRPDSLPLALSRIKSNFSYFRVNYTILISTILAFSLLSHPFSLLLILSVLFAWCSLYLLRPSDPPLVLFGRQFSERETLAGLVLASIVLFFMTSVGSLIVSAFLVGAGIACVHGAFRMPEDLFLDETDGSGPGVGLLSFLGGAAGGTGAGVRV